MVRGLRALVAAVALLGSGCSASHGGSDSGLADARPSPDTSPPIVDAGGPADAGRPPLCGPPSDCGVRDVVAGLAHTCALLADGTVGCWGSNERLELAAEDVEGSVLPLSVGGLREPTRLVQGYTYACAAAPEDALWCWGDGTEGLLGRSAVPRSDWVAGLSDVVTLSSGGAHTCAVLGTGEVHCWGFRNGDGQLGVGTREVHREPTLVEGVAGVVEIAAGFSHNCARTATRELFCWGRNREGQVGDGTGGEPEPTADALSPVAVLDGVTAVTAGGNFTCAARPGSEVWCWGHHPGARAGSPYALSPEPVALAAGVELVDLEAARGGGHVCAVTSAGRVLCWGSNGRGELGIGGGGSARVPVEAGGIDDATAVSLGYAHTCAIRAEGALWCWGANEAGQLGDGTTADRDLPVRVQGLW